MEKEKIFAVFGLGAFGFTICTELTKKGAKVIAIDNHEKLIEKITDSVTQAIIMDSTDKELFKTLPLEDIDVAVVAIGDNFEASILTTSLLKETGIPYIVARAISDTHSQILKQVGANEVFNIEIEAGQRIANKLISPLVFEQIPLSSNQILAEIETPKKFIDKKVGELNFRKKHIQIVSK